MLSEERWEIIGNSGVSGKCFKREEHGRREEKEFSRRDAGCAEGGKKGEKRFSRGDAEAQCKKIGNIFYRTER